MSSLLEHPLALPAAGGAAVLVGLLLLLRQRKRRSPGLDNEEASDSAQTGTEELAGDDSKEGPVSSMMYSPSQLDAGGDVDPVAEADVYLAYGRDKQAEEILLEALRVHPDRLPVHAKLLEIYAQRNDVTAYNAAAQALYDHTQGEGPEWTQARETGLKLDPTFALYRPAGNANPIPTASAAAAIASNMPDLDLSASSSPAQEAPATLDSFDFDLDLSNPPSPSNQDTAGTDSTIPDLSFDLDLEAPAPQVAPSKGDTTDDFDLDFELDTPTSATPMPSQLPDSIQDLSLDLDLPSDAPTKDTDLLGLDDLGSLEVDDNDSADPLETKLSLAQEFEAIGDTDGARSLAEEVAAEASGSLKARAEAFLAQLS